MHRQTKKTLMILLLAMITLLTACTGNEPKPPLGEVYLQIISQNILPDMVLLDEESGLDYLGIDSQLYTQQVMALSEDSLLADELLIFQAQSMDKTKALVDALQARLDAKAQEARLYSPEQYAIITKGRILQDGLYVALLVNPRVDALEAAYQKALHNK